MDVKQTIAPVQQVPSFFYPDGHPETTTVDGYAAFINQATNWATLVAGAGNDRDDGSGWNAIVGIYSHTVTDQWRSIYRGIFLFDTSSIPAAATVTGAKLSLYGADKRDDLSCSPDINVYASNPASNTAIAGTDYATLGSTPFCDTPITYANWVLEAYNDFQLNAAGLAAITKAGITKLGCRNANYEVAGTPPTWVSGQATLIQSYNAETSGKQPRLMVYYHL